MKRHFVPLLAALCLLLYFTCRPQQNPLMKKAFPGYMGKGGAHENDAGSDAENAAKRPIPRNANA